MSDEDDLDRALAEVAAGGGKVTIEELRELDGDVVYRIEIGYEEPPVGAVVVHVPPFVWTGRESLGKRDAFAIAVRNLDREMSRYSDTGAC